LSRLSADENSEHLAAIHRHLHAELEPVGDLETLLVERIVACTWRLRRLQHVEASAFQYQRRNLRTKGEPDTVGAAFTQACRFADTFSKLARYETTLERSLYRALHELQRIQAVRAGQLVPPPFAVDLDLNVTGLGGESR
jgi:hypothetical protein